MSKTNLHVSGWVSVCVFLCMYRSICTLQFVKLAFGLYSELDHNKKIRLLSS